MRKVRLAINVSLDGYLARPNGALDWVFRTMTSVQQAWTTDFLREVDTILVGHTTYLEQAAFWPTQTGEMADLMNSHTKIVFSSRLRALEWTNSRLAICDVTEEIARLKREPGRDIYVTGGAARSIPFPKRTHRRVQPDHSPGFPGERNAALWRDV